MASRARFVVLSGLHDGASARIDNAVTLVGAGPDCDVVLGDAGVAALHSSIIVGDGKPIVRSHAAAAGTDRTPSEVCRDWYEPWQIGPAWVAVVPADFEWKSATRWSPRAAAQGDAHAATRPFVNAATAISKRAALVMLPLVLTVGVLLAVAFGMSTLAAAPPTANATQAGRVAGIAARLQLADVKVGVDSGQVVLDGFVDSDAQLDELKREVRAVAPAAGHLMRVKVGAELARRAREFLADASIEAVYEGGGRIRLSGRPSTPDSGTVLPAKLSQLRADLGTSVQVRSDVDDADLRLPSAKRAEHRMPVRITEVQVDAPAHFRTSDGARYFEGARLPDGAEVVRIGAAEILFRRGGRDIRYSVVE